MSKSKPLESAIQAQIIKALTKSGWLVNKIITCTLNGWVDLEAIKNKRIVFIEAKREGERPRELQEYRHKQIRDHGFEVVVADQIEDIRHLI